MNKTLLICIAFLLLGCKQNTIVITNTIWGSNKLEDGWCDYDYFLTDSNFMTYNCEMGDTIKGKYYFVNDTLIIEEIADYLEGYIPTPNTCEQPLRVKYTAIVEKDSLWFINKYDWVEEEYVLLPHDNREGIVYQRI